MSVNRPVRIALLSSLLLNVALLAMLAVWGLGRQAGTEGPPPRGTASEAQRERFREAMAPYREHIRENYDAVRAARADVARTLRSEPLDATALQDAFARLREAEALASAASHEALTATAAQLDAEARARMAERVEHGRSDRRRRDRRRD